MYSQLSCESSQMIFLKVTIKIINLIFSIEKMKIFKSKFDNVCLEATTTFFRDEKRLNAFKAINLLIESLSPSIPIKK